MQNLALTHEMSENPPLPRKRGGNDRAPVLQRRPFHNSIAGPPLLDPTPQQRVAEGQAIAESKAAWPAAGVSIRHPPYAQANPATDAAAVITNTANHTRAADILA